MSSRVFLEVTKSSLAISPTVTKEDYLCNLQGKKRETLLLSSKASLNRSTEMTVWLLSLKQVIADCEQSRREQP